MIHSTISLENTNATNVLTLIIVQRVDLSVTKDSIIKIVEMCKVAEVKKLLQGTSKYLSGGDI